MGIYQVRINTKGAAFEGDKMLHEVARILRQLADDLERNAWRSQALRDINGNLVGAGEYFSKMKGGQ